MSIRAILVLSMTCLLLACEQNTNVNQALAGDAMQSPEIRQIDVSREQMSDWALPFVHNHVSLYASEQEFQQALAANFSLKSQLPMQQADVNQQSISAFILPKVDFSTQNLVFMLVQSGGPPLDQVTHEVLDNKTLQICTSPPESKIQGKALFLMAQFFVVEKAQVARAVFCR